MQARWSLMLALWIVVSFSAIAGAAGDDATGLRLATFRCVRDRHDLEDERSAEDR